MSTTQTNSRIFSIRYGEQRNANSRQHFKTHTLHIREWGLEVVADTGETTGYPWAAVHKFTLGHTD